MLFNVTHIILQKREVLVDMSDFKKAFSIVGPSMQRGFQVQVEKMSWNDVGGLEQVKKVTGLSFFFFLHVS